MKDSELCNRSYRDDLFVGVRDFGGLGISVGSSSGFGSSFEGFYYCVRNIIGSRFGIVILFIIETLRIRIYCYYLKMRRSGFY